MTHRPLILCVYSSLVFCMTFFSCPIVHGYSFSDYINSSQASSKNSVNKALDITAAPNDVVEKRADKQDTKPSGLQSIPGRWKACDADSECTAGVVDCVSWEALNKKYLHKLGKDLNACVASIDPGFQPQTACVAKTCQTTNKSTNVSWEEWLNDMQEKKDR